MQRQIQAVSEPAVNKTGLEITSDSQVAVSGPLTFTTAPGLLAKGVQVLNQTQQMTMTINLAGVDSCDSAGVALLLEWRRLAQQRKLRLHYQAIPDGLLAIARISDVADMLAD